MASAHPADEIDRLTKGIRHLEAEISAASARSRPVFHRSQCDPTSRSPPELKRLDLDTSSTREECVLPTARNPKRKEVEARRYNGKEPITEYLLQFELTARRNAWSDSEKATSLLCALDGPARGVLAEVDINCTSYREIKELLVKRFGPVLLTEVHEQALQDLKLTRTQSIRELTTEVTRLTKLAYPEFDGPARERFAVKALINAINDKDTIFYVKEKNPQSVDEVFVLYERYKVLTGNPAACKAPTVKGVKPTDEATAPSAMDLLVKRTEAHSKQLEQLTKALHQLVRQQQQPPMVCAPPSTLQSSPGTDIPRKPCPRCKQTGHWARDCPQVETCFRCGQPSHRRRDCRAPLNFQWPASAPHAGPQGPRHY